MIQRSAVYVVLLDILTPETLNRSIQEGKKVAYSRFGQEPTEVSIPIMGLPSWRDVVEAHRAGPWHAVTKFLGMQVSYNTLTEGEGEDMKPLLIFRYTVEEIP